MATVQRQAGKGWDPRTTAAHAFIADRRNPPGPGFTAADRRAEVTLWTRVLDGGSHEDCLLVAQKLAHLWADSDLDGLLHQEALDRLPPAERQESCALRGEIDVLIRRAETID